MEHNWEVVNGGDIVISNTPKELWDGACRYFAWCDMNPIVRKITLRAGKEAGRKVEEETQRPYTIKGLCLHCGIMEEYLREMRNLADKANLYYIVASKIMYVIYDQHQTLATVGVYNPIFTAKVLNMDNEDVPVSAIRIDIVTGLPELSTSENEILEKLELENEQMENF